MEQPTTLEAERLARLEKFPLGYGKHGSLEEGACVMEAVAYVAGEPWSDQPMCACPVLTAFCISLNDAWSAADRQRLKPFVVRLVGTRRLDLAVKREWMLVDWVYRVHQPLWYEAAGLREIAAGLRALPEVREGATDLAAALGDRAALAAGAACDALAARRASPAAHSGFGALAGRDASPSCAVRAALAGLDALARPAGAVRAVHDALNAHWSLGVLTAAEAIERCPKGTSVDDMREAGIQGVRAIAAKVKDAELVLLGQMIDCGGSEWKRARRAVPAPEPAPARLGAREVPGSDAEEPEIDHGGRNG